MCVSDLEKHEVRRYGCRDGSEGTIAAGGNGRGPALDQLTRPRNIFVDEDHFVHVSDAWNDCVIKWVSNAKEGVAPAGGHGYGKRSE